MKYFKRPMSGIKLLEWIGTDQARSKWVVHMDVLLTKLKLCIWAAQKLELERQPLDSQ